jgi:uncharacterized protein YdaU (DUF1376 family)
MAQFPQLPLFTDAYLADTRHLNAAQHGAYLLLLMMAWRTPDCAIPDDDATLARWASMDLRTWKNTRSVILAFWQPFTTPDGQQKWRQLRLLDERKRAEFMQSKNVAAGKISALKRKERGSTTVATEGQHPKNKHQSLSRPLRADMRCKHAEHMPSKHAEHLENKLLENNNTPSTSVATNSQHNFNPQTQTHIEDNKLSSPPVSPKSENQPKEKNHDHPSGKRLTNHLGDNPICPAEWANWSASQLGMGQDRIEATFAGFTDYWRACPGAKGRKSDWFATWRNWCRREAERSPRNSSQTGRAMRDGTAAALNSVMASRYGATNPSGGFDWDEAAMADLEARNTPSD